MSPPDDTGHVADIIAQLKRGGPLRVLRNNPSHRAAMPLETYVAGEVQKSIAQLRRLIEEPLPALPPDVPEPPTLADFHKASRMARDLAALLHKVALFDDHRAIIPKLERISLELGPVTIDPEDPQGKKTVGVLQFPPARADAMVHWGVKEAFDLMTYSAKAPTGYDHGAFRLISRCLVEATVGGCSEVTLRRACKRVLRDRRLHDPNAFKRP